MGPDEGEGKQARQDEDLPPNVLILPASVERELDESNEALGALVVAVAYVIARGIADITAVLVIIGLALFIAIGLNPILEFLIHHGRSRGFAVGVVILGFLVVIALFVLAAVSPISHEVQSLVKNYPRYKANIAAGKGWAGKLAGKVHLTGYLKQ